MRPVIAHVSRGEELIEVNEIMLGKVLGEVMELALAELIVQTIGDAINKRRIN